MYPILESTKYVIDHADHVTIHPEQILAFAQNFHASETPNHWMHELPFDVNGVSDERKLMLVTVFNAVSFSYRWDPWRAVTYQGKIYHRGSRSLVAAIIRAVEEGYDMLDPHFLSSLTEDQGAHILRANTGIPLLSERIAILREVGRTLVKKYHGSMSELVDSAHGDAQKFVEIILTAFPSFADQAVYKGEAVYFQKRAQALVESIRGLFGGRGMGALTGIQSLTALPDYILPNLLRHLGIISYSPALADAIDSLTEIPAGSAREVEIRAATVQAIEAIRHALEKEWKNVTLIALNDSLRISWWEVQTPFHRTRTICY